MDCLDRLAVSGDVALGAGARVHLRAPAKGAGPPSGPDIRAVPTDDGGCSNRPTCAPTKGAKPPSGPDIRAAPTDGRDWQARPSSMGFRIIATT
eukprot:6013260-Pyramimonas_sp.AAC.1